MASISSAGVGSGLDVASLVAQLVAAERAPASQRLALVETKANLKLSALGTFRSALAGLQSALAGILSAGALGKLGAQSSNKDLLGATAGSGAVAGSYGVEVVSLAAAHKLVSGVYAGSDTSLGNGEVSITVGSDSFTVTLDDSNNTLAGLRDAINAADDNAGVSATLINETLGTRLLLTAKTTGTADAVSVSSSLIALTEHQAAADAHVRVEGYDVYSSSNTVSDAIDGVTLTLLKAEPGTRVQLDVAIDTDAAKKAIEEFVARYNALIATTATVTRYDATSRQAAPLAGESVVRQAAQQLRSIIGSEVSGAGSLSHLSQLGIGTKSDGTLAIDSAKLANALSTDIVAVQKLFAADSGYGTRLDSQIESLLADDGHIDARNDSLQAQIKDVAKQRATLDLRMGKLEARYLAQFSALDSLLGTLRSTSDFLSQQLANLQRA